MVKGGRQGSPADPLSGNVLGRCHDPNRVKRVKDRVDRCASLSVDGRPTSRISDESHRITEVDRSTRCQVASNVEVTRNLGVVADDEIITRGDVIVSLQITYEGFALCQSIRHDSS